MSRAFVFPGQGAQTIGMGRALAEAYPAAKAVFDEVDAALGREAVGADLGGRGRGAALTAERAARADGDLDRRDAGAGGGGDRGDERCASWRGIRWANIRRSVRRGR